MKNVLIIASIYGSKRVLSLAKYLPQYGWQPIIITPPVGWHPTIITPKSRKVPDLPYKVIEAGRYGTNGLSKALKVSTDEEAKLRIKKILNIKANHSWLDSLFSIGGAFVNYPDAYKEWKPYALEEAIKQMTSEDIDCILSICPVMSHIVASKLKALSGIYWVADYTDLWSQNLNYSYGCIRKSIDRRLERRTFINVDSIVSCSELWVDRISKLHGDKPVNAITLGYDHEEYTGKSEILTKKFTVTYTGLIYADKQSPTNFLIALSDLFDTGEINREDCDIRFYGDHLGWLDNEFNKHGISDVAHQMKVIPHNEIVKIQQDSQVLLLLDWNDPKELGGYTSKVFEYLGARRPILAVGGVPGNTISRLMKDTHAGKHSQSVSDIKVILLDCYNEYKRTGQASYSGIESKIVKYGNSEMAKKYSTILSGGHL